MHQRSIHHITLLLLVWLVSQQAVAFVIHGVNHNLNQFPESFSIECSIESNHDQHTLYSAEKMQNSYMGSSSESNMPVCDHCATFCQPTLISLESQINLSGQPPQLSEFKEAIPVLTISNLYRPPILI